MGELSVCVTVVGIHNHFLGLHFAEKVRQVHAQIP